MRRENALEPLVPAMPLLLACAILSAAPDGAKAGPAAGAEKLVLEARSRAESPKDKDVFCWSYRKLEWDPRKIAIIICDMWDEHWCKGATARVAEMAPRMNEVVAAARGKGVLIVHAPSDTMKTYEDHPARARALKAPRAAGLPEGIGSGSSKIPAEDRGAWPIDQSDGGCDCEPQCKTHYPWRSQIAAIEIQGEDAISDSGVEIWNLFAERGVDNVILMGVHTNMCVIGRPFGLRNMVRFGKNVVLMRDLTDTMYNSRMSPRVSHFSGTDLVVEHIEKYVCPTVVSSDLTGKQAFRFAEDKRPRAVFISAENEYGAAEAFPLFARHLILRCGLAAEVLQGTVELQGPEAHHVPGMRALEGADLTFLFTRRRALASEDMKRFRDYLSRGKPLVAFRTSSHGFSVRGDLPAGCEDWKAFDREVLGCTYGGHSSGETRVTVVPEAAGHPILEGISGPYQVRETLYQSAPLAPTCRALLRGRRVQDGKDSSESEQPVAWTNSYQGARIFYTSLGSAGSSFLEAWFLRMVVRAAFWGLDRPVSEGALEGLEK